MSAVQSSPRHCKILIDKVGPLIDAEAQRLAQGGVAGGEWFDDYKDRDPVIGRAFQPASDCSWPEYGQDFARSRLKIREKGIAAGRGNR